MPPLSGNYSGIEAAILTELRYLREDVGELKQEMKDSTVSRGEYVERVKHEDARYAALSGRIKHLEAQRAPWWTYVTVMVGIAALLWSVVGPT